jgi:hypothetical protein
MAAQALSAGLLGLGRAAWVCWDWDVRPGMAGDWDKELASQGPADWAAGMAVQGDVGGVFVATLLVDGAPE